ncbi:MAG: CPBP family glutamic-type intramembrane protease [Candidatus Acidiferrales bacterium]|jgi:membrane protease YdiL (CAAX protease family)
MTFANPVKAAENLAVLPTESFQPNSQPTFGFKQIFVGPNGLRAGWRVLMFIALVAVLFGSFILMRAGGPAAFREQYRNQKQSQITITPLLMGGSEAITLLVLCVAALVMGKIEHRKFGEYGLPLRLALRKDFWVGSLIGFSAISGTLLTIFLLHGFRVSGLALHGTAILSSLFGWGIAFLLAGLVEEFLFRGYIQYTLTTGIGFWPAAFLMSGLFGLGHFFNSHETPRGSATVVLFGLLLCLFLQRTGNLWCAVGFHLGYDWGQMFYGVPDSGIVPYQNMLNSTLSGPTWITGGSVGPEASFLTPLALLVVAVIFSRYYPETRYQVAKPKSMPVRIS